MRVVPTVAVVLFLLVLVPQSILAQQARPRKYVNLKAGAALYALQADRPPICSDTTRILGQFGVQTAFFPFTLEVDYYTNVGLEIFGGGWWPALKLGYGWLAVSGGAFYKTTLETRTISGATACADDTVDDVEDTFGIGAAVEYLLYDGYLGFYVEVKQALIRPEGTVVAAGINVSPLLWLLFRRY